mmetsp:Transcript_36966/g.27332  ORF Transcript_36966/g.27332 Transcript_36966/m.27332 type:complete len:80 (-) Transcript_36966:497-736(-)
MTPCFINTPNMTNEWNNFSAKDHLRQSNGGEIIQNYYANYLAVKKNQKLETFSKKEENSISEDKTSEKSAFKDARVSLC